MAPSTINNRAKCATKRQVATYENMERSKILKSRQNLNWAERESEKADERADEKAGSAPFSIFRRGNPTER